MKEGLTCMAMNEVGSCIWSHDLKEKVRQIQSIHNFWIIRTYCGRSESEEWSSVKRLAELTEMLGGDLFDKGLQKLVLWYDKCLNLLGNCREI